jgi:hypothetical protein
VRRLVLASKSVEYACHHVLGVSTGHCPGLPTATS